MQTKTVGTVGVTLPDLPVYTVGTVGGTLPDLNLNESKKGGSGLHLLHLSLVTSTCCKHEDRRLH